MKYEEVLHATNMACRYQRLVPNKLFLRKFLEHTKKIQSFFEFRI